MLPENTIPVVSKITPTDKNIVAFSINGVLTNAEIENLYGLLDAAIAQQDQINLILIFKEYDGMDWKSLFAKDTAPIRAEAAKKINRYAIVGGPAWLNPAISILQPLKQNKIKWFSQIDEKKAWDFINTKP